MVSWLRAAFARLLCRWFGHRIETRAHYMRERVLSIARCRRCGHVERSNWARGSYPMPRSSAR